MSGFALEATLHWIAVGLYLLSTVLFAHAVIFDRPQRARYGVWLAALGLLPHSVALIMRWVASGHGPYMLRYEVLSSDAWICVVVLLAVLWWRPSARALAMIAMPAAALMVAAGLFTNPEIRELPPSLRSIWLVFHVLFAKLATGAFLLSLAAAIILLFKLRRGEASGSWLDRVPAPDALQAYITRFVGFGFLFWTITVAAGAIWAHQSWGRYWGWDPIETSSLVVWLCYGSYLHIQRFFKLSGRGLAWVAIACFVVAALTIFVIPFTLASIHESYFQ